MSGSPRFFEEALLANWNPRATYAVRSPWENLGGSLPAAGSAGGPWFFGAYTRDLYDEAVSWGSQTPVFRNGRYHGNPFGTPQEGQDRYVLFDLPRTETGVVSLGQLQNAKVSEFIWHPSFAIGNSLADPRLGLDGLNRTVPGSASSSEDAKGGFHRNAIGWSRDIQRSKGRDDWASTGRALLQNVPDQDHVVYDLSFEINHALWDRYFLSSGTSRMKAAFAADPSENPLPNGRMQPATGAVDEDALEDFHQAASQLMVDGAFNVNSTSIEAWKAVLASTRDAGDGAVRFARVLDPPGGTLNSASDPEAWSGMRQLTDEEIGRLAEEIVIQIKERGPFLSMSDFVNRRLVTADTGRRGALQEAIDRAGLNESFNEVYPLDNDESLEDYRHPDNIADATRMEQQLKPESKAWGASGYLTQADVLQVLGPMLTVRSDSFLIRAYGESLNASGDVEARAWCEAVVQRVPEPIRADASGLNPEVDEGSPDFGRRFQIVRFRWLQPQEV
jgi:hypothetical protein